MELTAMRQFRAIAAHRHMTRAARALGLTQPALSVMLRKLEAEVGTTLMHRGGRGVELTEPGRVFLAYCDQAVRAADEGVRAVREVVGLERGTIRVGGGATATTYLLPPVVSAVRRKHPGLRFYIREAGSRAVAAAVAGGELDLGIITLPVLLADSDALVRVPLVEDELLLIVPPGHRLRAAKRPGAAGTGTFRWKDVAGESLVGFEAGSAVRDVIDRAGAAQGVTLNVVMELRSIESITEMVRAGIGVGFVSRFAVREGEGLRCADGRLTRSLAIVRKRDRAPSAAAEEFEKTLMKSVRS